MASEEIQVNMVHQEDTSPVTMEGYLDKRGKMKLVSTWKRYWFVLKGQLLLYYKTQHECNNLSVCRGSLNMGLASCVRPGANRGPPANGAQGYTIEVVTRTQVIILRTKDRSLQEQWLKALLDSMALPISTPIRNSTGPMHFRYSLDNLPVIDEAESVDKNKEKQSTLPHGASVSRRDSLLGRIKKIGGTSYGGSLETVIKHRTKTQQMQQQSPQQPKIPRIKAVDRMLGLHQTSEETAKENDKNNSVPVTVSQNGMVSSNKCLNDSKIKCEKDDDSNSNGELENSSNGDTSANSSFAAFESEEVKPDSKHSVPLEVAKNNNENYSYIKKSDKNQNCENFCVTKSEETKRLTWSMIENEKHVLYIESQEGIIIENKFYDKNIKTKIEDRNAELDNKQSNQENSEKSDKKEKEHQEYSSEEELTGYKHVSNINIGNKMYEEVNVSETTVKQNENNEYDEEEEEYYSQYDKFSLLKSLPDQEHEPKLPPRPSVSSKSSNEFVKSQNQNNEDVEYNTLYETTLNTTNSYSKLESSGGESSPRGKKKSKLHKLKTKKKKSPNKESVDSEDGHKNTSTRKKRKMSFLHRMLKHYRKKPDSQNMSVDDAEDSEDPEYESVDYATALTVQVETENDQTQSAPSEIESPGGSPLKELHKERIFGTNLLSEQGMMELKMKLKDKNDSVNSDAAFPPSILGDKEKNECISTDDVQDKKPVPTPRPSKQKSEHQTGIVTDEKSHINEGIDRPNKPPKLPPRKVGRPPSPWHDVPKNNSPIYGNFDDLAVATQQENEKNVEDSSKKQAEEKTEKWNEDIQDDLLGTPLGFAYIQNKWKAAEKSGELTSKGKVSPVQKSPGKNRSLERSSEECRRKHTRSSSNSSVGKSSINSIKSDYSDAEQNCSTSEVYTEIQRMSAKSIIKNFNSQSNRKVETTIHPHRNIDQSKCDSVFFKVKSNENLKVSNVNEVICESVRSDNHVECNNDFQNIDSAIDTTVTLRRSQDLVCQKTELNHSPPSSQDSSTFMKGEFRSRSDSSTQTSQISHNGSLGHGNAKEVCGNGIDDGEEYDIMPRLNRHSDELNILLAQLAEITSAPLLPQGVATSLSDIPDGRKSKLETEKPPEPSQLQPEQFVLGPIRRRRHSDPDYDVPRPHGSLLHLLAANRTSSRSSQSHSGQESDVIEATHFFGEQDLISNSGRSSLSLRHSVISEVDDQSDTSYYVSMAPDSLEVPQVKDVEGVYT